MLSYFFDRITVRIHKITDRRIIARINRGEALSFSRGAGGAADAYRAGSGVTFGPTWREHDRWVRISDLHTHYRATPEVHFVHPLLVRFSLTYSYLTGRGGPYFRQDFVVTPDGVFSRLVSPQDDPFALTVPLLEDDGRALDVSIDDRIASTRYAPGEDQQNFIGLNADTRMTNEAPSIQSSYGWLKPVRYESPDPAKEVFVYPRSPTFPSAHRAGSFSSCAMASSQRQNPTAPLP